MESIYVYRDKQLEKVGETNPNDPTRYILNSSDLGHNPVYQDIINGVELSELSNSENVAILPTPDEYNEIMKSKSDSWRSHREEGGHFDSDGNVHRWDRGPRLVEGATEISISISPFVTNDVADGNSYSASLYWHVHPKIYISSGVMLGKAEPSPRDKEYDKTIMRRNGYKGTTLLVGATDDAITFYYGDTTIATVPIKVLNKLLKKDKQK